MSIAETTFDAREAKAARAAKLQVQRDRLYRGIGGLDDPLLLMENARKVARRIRISKGVLDFLYAHSRFPETPRDQWEAEVFAATAFDLVVAHHFPKASVADLEHIVDMASVRETVERLKSSRGTLVLAFHGPFRTLLLKIFRDCFEGGYMIRKVADNNRGDALFVAMRTLMQGQSVFIAPDGPFGSQLTTIDVLGAECAVAVGASFLAYETRCEPVFVDVVRSGPGFALRAEPCPRRQVGERSPDFQTRLHQFYKEQLEYSFTAQPQNICLGGRWKRYFNEMLAARQA